MEHKIAVHIDGVLRRVLGVTLNPAHATGSVIFLDTLAQELPEGAPTLLNVDMVEMALIGRLSPAPDADWAKGQPWPVFYLIGAWGRASDELRGSIPSAFREPVQATLRATKELLASYTALVLLGVFIPESAQSEAAEQRGALQLLDALDQRTPNDLAEPIPPESIAGGVVAMPPGFLEDLAATDAMSDPDQIDAIFHPVVERLSKRFLKITPLDNWGNTMTILLDLRTSKPVLESIVRCPSWLPPSVSGRTIQEGSLLGRPMMLSVISDHDVPDLNVRTQFPGASLRNPPADFKRTMESLRVVQTSINKSQFEFVNSLLRNKNTKEAIISWMAHAINANSQERGKTQMDATKAASDGFFINLNAVLLQLCQPFIDPESKPARTSIDPKYVLLNKRLDLREDTKLAVDSEEQGAWLERVASGAEATTNPNSTFGFTSDCFFMTAKALNIGLLKAFQHMQDLARTASSLEEQVNDAQGRMDTYPPHIADLLRRQVAEMQRVCKLRTEDYFLLSSIIVDESLLLSALSFYRLEAAWLLRLASPSYAAPRAPGLPAPRVELPLPSPAPITFRLLPEFMVTDMLELLLIVSRVAGEVFTRMPNHELEEFMMFIVVFLASPDYVHNPYVRSRMAEVLRYWLPESEDRVNFRRRPPATSVLQDLIGTQQLAQTHLVRSLLTLYSDIEHTGRNQAFYEKFSCRQVIGEILDYLWKVPVHHKRWLEIAAAEGGEDELYGRFCHHLETDAIWLLNDALDLLPQIREAEKKLEDERASMSQEQVNAQHQAMERHGDALKSDLALAAMTFHIISFSTTEITATWLSPAMASRIAATLNYFLRHITGPDRKKLKVKNPEKYSWNPRELLTQIARIYVNLYRANRNTIAEAVASEQRSYNDTMFDAAIEVLNQTGSLEEAAMQDLAALAQLVSAKKQVLAQQEAVDEEAPEEFNDELLGTVMDDPVMLPDSKVYVDRATIQRHLLSNPNDPFTRAALTLDMVVPAPDLKERIQAWRRQQRTKNAPGAAGEAPPSLWNVD